MAEGVHWEWRAFGGVSARFVKLYCGLSDLFDSQTVEDLYLWIPGLEVNAKFRTGAEGGLKFKRIKKKAGELEKWFENPEELFDFPLNAGAWDALSEMLNTVDLSLPEAPDKNITRQHAVELLRDAGCRPLLVKKNREAKSWAGPNGTVKVEWACISEPQSMVSIGLENWTDEGAEELNDESAKEDLSAAIDFLGLKNEPLRVMNYMEAVETWAGKDSII
jgi:hypothetical protein